MRELGGGGVIGLGACLVLLARMIPACCWMGDDARRGNEQLSRRWCAR